MFYAYLNFLLSLAFIKNFIFIVLQRTQLVRFSVAMATKRVEWNEHFIAVCSKKKSIDSRLFLTT